MYTIIKNKGKTVKAYELGSKHPAITEMIRKGKIRPLENGRYKVFSQESSGSGETAEAGDWVKTDSKGYLYPNRKEWFEANHRHIERDLFEQIPQPLKGWDCRLDMCPEVEFLTEKKGLAIDRASSDRRYTAELWGTTEIAAEDAMIVFYNISYDDAGNVTDAEYNFVERSEFDRTYSVLG